MAMPVIVIGADTPNGPAVVEALAERAIEVRAFITNPALSTQLRATGAKVAKGDVSDGSHVEAAAMGCFCAVVMAGAANDDRERSFVDTAKGLHRTWLEALTNAGVSRIIWAEDPTQPLDPLTSVDVTPELIIVDDGLGLPARVADLEDAETIEPHYLT